MKWPDRKSVQGSTAPTSGPFAGEAQTFGFWFNVSSAIKVVGFRWYTEAQRPGAFIGQLWSPDGSIELCHALPPLRTTNEVLAAPGWIQEWCHPFGLVEPGNDYLMQVTIPAGGWYFTSGAVLAGPITVDEVTIPTTHAGLTNGWYSAGYQIAEPVSTASAGHLYGVDLLWLPAET